MTIGEILNRITCGASSVLGVGSKGCKMFFKKTSALWITPAGFKYDSTRELDDEYIRELQTKGTLTILKGIRTFADNTSEDTFETLEDGTKIFANAGLYEFAAEFINGLYFNAALNSLNTFGNFDIALIDKDSNLLGTRANDGSLKGITTGYIQAMPLKWATDTVGQKEGLGFQFLNRSEIDSDFYIVQRKQLDVNLLSYDDVNEVLLEYAAVPSNGDTTISIKASLRQGGRPFTGLDHTNFLHQINGVASAATGGDDSAKTGTYVLTVPAVATNEVSSINLQAGNDSVITLDGDVYKSNVASETVV